MRGSYGYEVFRSEEVSQFQLELDCPARGFALVSIEQRLLFGCQFDLLTARSLWLAGGFPLPAFAGL